VRGRSRQLSAITLAYRFAPRWRRNGLEEQQTASLLPAGVPVVNPDVTAAGAVAEAMTSRRDLLLLGALQTIYAERGAEAITVAVLYGAGHIPAVVSGLRDHLGYRPRRAEWLTVISPQ
jgi:hypothetical protein